MKQAVARAAVEVDVPVKPGCLASKKCHVSVNKYGEAAAASGKHCRDREFPGEFLSADGLWHVPRVTANTIIMHYRDACST